MNQQQEENNGSETLLSDGVESPKNLPSTTTFALMIKNRAYNKDSR